jgi:hypothetical protein
VVVVTFRICGQCRNYNRRWCARIGNVSRNRIACDQYDENPEAVAADRCRVERTDEPQPKPAPVMVYKLEEADAMRATPETRAKIDETCKAPKPEGRVSPALEPAKNATPAPTSKKPNNSTQKTKLPPEKVTEIVETYKATSSISKTSDATGVAQTTVRNVLKLAGIPWPREAARHSMQRLTLDQVRQQLEQRIERHRREMEEAQRALTALQQLQKVYDDELAEPLLAGVWEQYEARRAKSAEVAA